MRRARHRRRIRRSLRGLSRGATRCARGGARGGSDRRRGERANRRAGSRRDGCRPARPGRALSGDDQRRRGRGAHRLRSLAARLRAGAPCGAGQRAAGRDGGRRPMDRRVGDEPGGTVDPGKLVAGLAAAARRAGAEIHPSTAASRDHRARRQATTACAAPAGRRSTPAHVVVSSMPMPRSCVNLPLAFRSRADVGALHGAVRRGGAGAHRPGRIEAVLHSRLCRICGAGACADGRVIFGAGLIFPCRRRRAHACDLERAGCSGSRWTDSNPACRGLHPLLADVRVTHRWGGPIAFRPGGAPDPQPLAGEAGRDRRTPAAPDTVSPSASASASSSPLRITAMARRCPDSGRAPRVAPIVLWSRGRPAF